MDPPVEEKPLSNGIDPAKQELQEPTPRLTPQENTTVELETPPTYEAGAYYEGNIEEPISVSCAVRALHHGLQLVQVDSNDDDSAIGDLSRM